jgi:hypothetical protein
MSTPERMPRAEMLRRLENLHVNAADRVARLTRGFHDRDVVAGASADADALAEAMRLLGEGAACRELLYDAACAGVEFDDARLDYVSVQVDRTTWNELVAYRDAVLAGSDKS